MNKSQGYTFIALVLLFLAFGASAQDKAHAKNLALRAIALEDEGKMDSVLSLLQQANAIDPNNSQIIYEIGYYYYHTKNYDKAIETFDKVKKLSGGKTWRLYQILGNSYDYKGDSLKAVDTYIEGIKEFPNAGALYLELGNIHSTREHYVEAINYYEKGINADPTHASNYYRATQIWLSSTTAVWGMMYGEIFMNLERNSKRTQQMSIWLANTYRDNIKIRTKDSASVSFYQWRVNADDKKTMKDLKKGKLHTPFGAAYENCLVLSIILMDTMSYDNMCTLRNNFIEHWYKMGFNKDYPNLLFEYQHQLKEKGMLNAYNHWILSQASLDEFSAWKDANLKEWETFLNWFMDNQLKVTEKNKFLMNTEE